MVCSIQKKMIATFCWGFKEYTLPPQELPFSVYLTLKHPCIKLFKQTKLSLA